MAVELATAYVSIVPSVRGMRREMERQIIAPASVAGTEAGQKAGRNFSAGFGSVIGGLTKVIAGVTAGSLAAGGAITAFGIKGAASLETTTTAFTSLLGSSKAATDQIAQLQAFAAKTPFSQQDVFSYAQQYFALADSIGLAKDQVQPFLTTIGNIAAVTGASTENIHNAVLAIGQMGSSGKVTLENLNQVSEAFPGFNGAAAIAAATGQKTADVLAEISDGSLDAKTGVQALLTGMQKFNGAAGAMAKQSETLKGVWSTFTDTISIQLTKAFQPLIPTIKTTLTQLVPVISSTLQTLAPAIQQFVTGLAPLLAPLIRGLSTVLTSVFQALGPALRALTPVIEPLAGAFAQLVRSIAPLLTFAAQMIAQIGPPLINVFNTLMTSLAPVVQTILNQLAPVLPPLANAFAQLVIAVAPLVTALAGALAPVLPIIGQALTDIATALQPVITAIVNALLPVLPILATSFGDVVKALAPIASTLGQALVSVITAIAPQLPTLATAWASMAVSIAKILAALSPIIDLFARLVAMGLGPVLRVIGKAAYYLAAALKEAAKWAELLLNPLSALPGIDLSTTVNGVGSVAEEVNVVRKSFADAALDALRFRILLGEIGLAAKVTAADMADVVAQIGAVTAAAAGADAAAAASKRARDAAGVAAAGRAAAQQTAAQAAAAQAAQAAKTPTPAKTKATLPAFDASTLRSFFQQASGTTTNPLTSALNAIFASARAAGKKLSNGVVATLRSQNADLIRLTNERDKVAQRLQNAQQHLTDLIQQRNQEASTIKQAVTGTFNVGAIPKPQFGEPLTLVDIMRKLNKAVADARSFNSILRRLARAGLPTALLQQLAEAGPEALPAAKALLTATPKQLNQIKSQFRELTRQGGSIGKFVANDMFKSGIDAAEGLVKGLKSKQSQLNHTIRNIARTMIREMRRELDMHSPSKRLFKEAALAFEGYRQGIASKHDAIGKEAKRVANGSVPESQMRTWQHGLTAAAGRTINLTQNIHNPIPEPASRTTPASIRRAAYALGR